MRIESAAARQRRSINAETVYLLEFALDYFDRYGWSQGFELVSEDDLEREAAISKSIQNDGPDLRGIGTQLQSLIFQLGAIKDQVSRISIGPDGGIEFEMPATNMDLVSLDRDETKN